jgi:UDPglucose--hexose-1-phosphate uridylyltransferase
MAFAQTAGRMNLPQWEQTCPFCPGNENATNVEVHRLIQNDGSWLTRTIKNKFPALQENLIPTQSGDFFHTKIEGFGIHEVIIDTPRHDRGMPGLPLHDIEKIIETYRHRYLTHEQDPRVRHVILFKNNGEKAGSSLIHPHSQLIATPMISIWFNMAVRFFRSSLGREFVYLKTKTIFLWSLIPFLSTSQSFPAFLIYFSYSGSELAVYLFPIPIACTVFTKSRSFNRSLICSSFLDKCPGQIKTPLAPVYFKKSYRFFVSGKGD